MKVVFCDIDGVLNSDYFTRKNGGNRSEIEERKVKNLKMITSLTNANVVIVSHANGFFGKDYEQMRLNMIRQYGVNPIASLKCEGLLFSKNDIVKKWIEDNKVTKFVIFDDSKDNYTSLSHSLILINGKHGLTKSHVKSAIKLLS